MKHLKIFESLFGKFEYQQDRPQIGDYVKVYGDYFDSGVIAFIKTNIGKIIDINNGEFPYLVEFEEIIPNNLNKKIMNFTDDEIVEWAPAKDLFDIAKDTRKYNL